jgi:hypothetical protein
MCQSLLGIPSLIHFINRRKLIFVRQLTELPNDCVAKQIFLIRLCHFQVGHIKMKGCIPDLLNVLTRYGLSQTMTRYTAIAEAVPPKGTWKTIIDEAIVRNVTNEYTLRTTADADFERFNRVKSVPLYPGSHWLCAQKVPLSLPVLTNAVRLLTLPKKDTVILCEFCGELYRDSLYHKTTSCPSTGDKREEFFECVTDNFSIQLSAHLNNMNDNELLDTLLGACTPETDALLSDDDYTSLLYLSSLYLFSIKNNIFM